MSAKIVYITTLQVCRAAVDRLMGEREIALATEGANSNSNGGNSSSNSSFISLLQIYSKIQNTVFLFDIISLGKNAFHNGGSGSVKSRDGGNLRKVLESEDIQKIMFDCRSGAEILYDQYNIRLKNVFDIQILYTTRFESYSGALRGLGKVLTMMAQTSRGHGSMVARGPGGNRTDGNRADSINRESNSSGDGRIGGKDISRWGNKITKVSPEYAVKVSTQDLRFREAGVDMLGEGPEDQSREQMRKKGNGKGNKGNPQQKSKKEANSSNSLASDAWQQRPMSEALMRYAATSVHYLIQMKGRWGDDRNGCGDDSKFNNNGMSDIHEAHELTHELTLGEYKPSLNTLISHASNSRVETAIAGDEVEGSEVGREADSKADNSKKEGGKRRGNRNRGGKVPRNSSDRRDFLVPGGFDVSNSGKIIKRMLIPNEKVKRLLGRRYNLIWKIQRATQAVIQVDKSEMVLRRVGTEIGSRISSSFAGRLGRSSLEKLEKINELGVIKPMTNVTDTISDERLHLSERLGERFSALNESSLKRSFNSNSRFSSLNDSQNQKESYSPKSNTSRASRTSSLYPDDSVSVRGGSSYSKITITGLNPENVEACGMRLKNEIYGVISDDEEGLSPASCFPGSTVFGGGSRVGLTRDNFPGAIETGAGMIQTNDIAFMGNSSLGSAAVGSPGGRLDVNQNRSGSPHEKRKHKSPRSSPRRKLPALKINVAAPDDNVPFANPMNNRSPMNSQSGLHSPIHSPTHSPTNSPVDRITPDGNQLRKRKQRVVGNVNNGNHHNEQVGESGFREGKHKLQGKIPSKETIGLGLRDGKMNSYSESTFSESNGRTKAMGHRDERMNNSNIGRPLSDRPDERARALEQRARVVDQKGRVDQRDRLEKRQLDVWEENRYRYGGMDLKYKKFDIYVVGVMCLLCSIFTAVFCYYGGWRGE